METPDEQNRRLYIIGNGFDLYHLLPTKYENFHRFLNDNYLELVEFIEQYFCVEDLEDNYHWNNFEHDLSSFDYNQFFDDYDFADITHDRFRPVDYFGVEDELTEIADNFIDEIKFAFYEWLSEVEYLCSHRYELSKKSKFLSFNYTLLLQNYYEIPSDSIFYIHGNLNKQTELVFGHGIDLEIESEFDDDGEPNRTLMTDSINASKSIFGAFRKPVQDIIKNNKDFFKSLKETEEIIILGHSLNEVDLPYFIKIQKFAFKANWKISTHNADDEEKFCRIFKRIGIDESKIEFFKMNN